MRTTLHIVLLWLMMLPASAQVVELSGVINRYVAVTRVDSCTQRIEVESTEGLAAGDRVLLVQMKGGVIDQDTSGSNFGRLLDFGAVGVYHFGTIATIAGNTIDLLESVSRGFDVSGLVQLVTVPRYSNARVVDTLRPMRWNGRLGGVVALEVTDTLWLDAPVDATGMGFRGGRMVVQDREDCSVPQRVFSIYSSLSGGRGESYVYYDTIAAHGGRARAAGAGGGGNSSNSGGGGGAGFGGGGGGGGQYTGCGSEIVSGEGGAASNSLEFSERVFLGSGGGAGHSNNNQGTDGGFGGGIAIVRSSHLYGNNQYICADGQSVRMPSGIDGAGGGGGGGTVIFEYDSLDSPVSLTARGGDGGSGGGPNGCHGPGGGGGGGVVQIAVEDSRAIIGISVDGGRAGRYTAANVSACVDSEHSAEGGAVGAVTGDIVVIEGHSGGEFSVAPISGAPGDTVEITLMYRGALDSAFRPIRGVTTTIDFDPRLISVGNHVDEINRGTLQLYRPLRNEIGTIARYRAVLLLGASGTGTISIRSVLPDLAKLPRFCQWRAITIDAAVSIELCEEGTTRVVRVGPATALKIIAPNPSQGRSVATFTVAEHGPVTLTLIDALGVDRRTVFVGTLSPGEYAVPIDLTDVAVGRYVLRLATSNEAATSALVIQP